MEKTKCKHEWVYSNQILLSNPPQQRKVCRLCKETGTDTMGDITTDEYSQIMNGGKNGKNI